MNNTSPTSPSNAPASTPAPILFVHYGDEWLRGSERCLLDLITHLDRTRFTPIVWCNSQTFAEAVTALQVPVHRSSFPLLLGWKAPRFSLQGWRHLIQETGQLIQQHDIRLIHANSAAPCQWLNHAARQHRVPLVAHLHARYPARDRLTLGLHHLPVAVGVSQPVVQQLLDDGVPAQNVDVIPNGLDTEALDAVPEHNIRKTLQLDDSAFVLITTGSLIHRKGVDLLIDALSQLHASEPDMHLVVIGDGDSATALNDQAHQLKLQDRVHFLGEQSHVTGWLRGGADLYVTGAREEVFGLALAEASLCELAVIAPDVGGISSVIHHQTTGLLVTPNDANPLANAIQTLKHHPIQRQHMGQAGRQRVLEHFTIQQNVRCFEQLYQYQLEQPAAMPWRFGTAARALTKTLFKSVMYKLCSLKRRLSGSCTGTTQRILVLDPTAFTGGSKIATENLLRPLINQTGSTPFDIAVLSADSHSWPRLNGKHLRLYLPNWLAKQQQGLPFFALNGLIALQVLLARLRLGKIDIAIGASGPGVDLGLYFARSVLCYRILQMVHGPVATSRTIGRCLNQADQVQYLDTTKPSLLAALDRYQPGRPQQLPETFHPFHNTLPYESWPAPCQYQTARVLWAASLLEWKGLPTLLSALKAIPSAQRPETRICYIRPAQTQLGVSEAPVAIDGVEWFEQPDNLDDLRAGCNVFVSTSHQEPFGLSILEAMAAGHCVVIPSDGAYWDKQLTHERDCLKYPPNDTNALATLLGSLHDDPDQIKSIGTEAAQRAVAYRSDHQPDSLHHFFQPDQ